jgi:hypothetical protein
MVSDVREIARDIVFEAREIGRDIVFIGKGK